MSSSNSPVFTLELRWSRSRRLVLVAQILVGLGVPWLTPWHNNWRMALCAATLALIGVSCRYLGWLGPRRPLKANWLSSGRWVLECADGSQCDALLRGSSRVNAVYVYLHLSPSSPGAETTATYRLLLIRGEYSPEVWRRLRARLRLEGGREPAVESSRN